MVGLGVTQPGQRNPVNAAADRLRLDASWLLERHRELQPGEYPHRRRGQPEAATQDGTGSLAPRAPEPRARVPRPASNALVVYGDGTLIEVHNLRKTYPDGTDLVAGGEPLEPTLEEAYAAFQARSDIISALADGDEAV